MARTNHSVFDRSLAIHESGDAEAEDKNALCLELVGYLSQQVKNETDLVLSPVTTHGGEVMEASLECLEKRPKHHQALFQQSEAEGPISTEHQKEVFQHRKHDIPLLYNSPLQPSQEDSIVSESSQDMTLELETAAVTLPAAVVVPSKVTPEPVNTQLAHEQDVAPKPKVASTVPVSSPVPTSLADGVSDAPVVFPLQERADCSAMDRGMSEQKQLNSCNAVASSVEVQKIVELPAESQAFLTGEDLSPRATQIIPEHPNVLEECPPPSLPRLEVTITTKENDETCEVSNGKQVPRPLKVVVERVEDYDINNKFTALEMMSHFNMEGKEVPSHEVSSSSHHKIKSPLKRNAGDPKLPPFKSRSKRVQHTKTRKQNSAHCRQVRNDNLPPLCDKEQICDTENSKQNVARSHGLLNTVVGEVSVDAHGNGSSGSGSNKVADDEVTQRTMPNSAEFLTPHVDMQETNQKFIKPVSCDSKMSLISRKKHIQDMKMVDQNTLCKANMLKTVNDAQRRVRKCSVSVCRIDTTLGPSATFIVPDGDSRLIVFTPDVSGSPFKVYEDKQASTKQRKSTKVPSGFRKAHGMTCCSANRSLIGKYGDVTEMDSVQNKPSVSLDINPLRGESIEYPASECCLSEEVNRSRSEDNHLSEPEQQRSETSSLTADKEGPLKPRAREHRDSDAQRKVQKCSIPVCRIDTILGPGATIIVPDGESRLIVFKPDDSGSPFKVYEDNQASSQERKSAELTDVRKNSSKRKREQTVNASNCDSRVLKVIKEDIPRPESGLYLLRCAGAVKDPGNRSPLPRTSHLYRMSDGGSSHPETLQGSVAQCETPSLASMSNIANVPCKGALGLAFGEHGAQPSQKKWVCFPDREVSSIRYFDTEEGGTQGRRKRCSPYTKTRRLLGKRRGAARCCAAGSSGTSLEDESPISVFSNSFPDTDSPCGKGVGESDENEVNCESMESSLSPETFQRSVADLLKSMGSKRDSLAALLKEVGKVLCQYGSGVLEEEIQHVLPAESLVQCASSILASDMSLDLPLSQYQKLMEGIAKRVTCVEPLPLHYNAALAYAPQNTGCQ